MKASHSLHVSPSDPLTLLQAFIERNGLQTQQAPALPGSTLAAAVLQSRPSAADPGVDVLRLSCAARSNLESAVGAVEYGAASGAAEAPGDVQLHNTDAELDFEEQAAAAGGSGAAERGTAHWNLCVCMTQLECFERSHF